VNTKRGFAAIVLAIIVGILLLGIGSYFLVYQKADRAPISVTATPTPDPTANWKRYINSKYSYSIKYPNDWQITIIGGVPEDISEGPVFQTPNCIEQGIRCATLQITTNDLRNSPYETFDSGKYYNSQYGSVQNPNITVEGEQKITFHGIPAMEKVFWQNVRIDHINPELYKYVVFVENKTAYIISLYEGYYNDDYNIKSLSDWQNHTTFNQILSSFEFTD